MGIAETLILSSFPPSRRRQIYPSLEFTFKLETKIANNLILRRSSPSLNAGSSIAFHDKFDDHNHCKWMNRTNDRHSTCSILEFFIRKKNDKRKNEMNDCKMEWGRKKKKTNKKY